MSYETDLPNHAQQITVKEAPEQGNRLIADFMGYYFQGDKFYSRSSGKGNWFKEAKYDRSWDWLMPVVEKIEKMDYGFKMCRKVVEVYIDSTKAIICKEKRANRMESLYAAVIYFVEWYNKNVKQ